MRATIYQMSAGMLDPWKWCVDLPISRLEGLGFLVVAWSNWAAALSLRFEQKAAQTAAPSHKFPL